ncbi:hypothetical protein B7698_05810 [Streptococcus mitis]|uniref:HeH/LEM domain-containing protein n=1 Tax=Streptococcus mitis TaxID=28037 RepID=A0A1X1K5M1_STRMT|nr:hypothetical protein B7698_05810 [Streptococcus mitis]
MALYRDIKTGAVISSDSLIGGDWVLVDTANSAATDMTVAELKSTLEDMGVDYERGLKKSELVTLYEASREL